MSAKGLLGKRVEDSRAGMMTQKGFMAEFEMKRWRGKSKLEAQLNANTQSLAHSSSLNVLAWASSKTGMPSLMG